MIVELKKGYTIESRYDKFSDSYITRLLDNESKQVGDALSSKDIVGKNQDIKSVRDYFTNYINNKRVEEEIPDEIDYIEPEEEFEEEEDIFEESLNLEDFDNVIKQKARKTKKATRKAKLPALSKMSPIMPDYAKGIDAFNSMQADGNSSMGSTTGSISLGEEFKDRNSLIKELQDMGFNYKFDKYSDKQLYRIYQERTKAAKKKEAEKREQQKASDLADHKRENSKDSYFRDGIEFESEDAAREYFGESMENNELKRLEKTLEEIAPKIFGSMCNIEFTEFDDTIIFTVYCRAADILFGQKYEASTYTRRLSQKLREKLLGWSVTFEGFSGSNKYLHNNAFDFRIRKQKSKKSPQNNSIEVNESMENKFYLNDLHEAWDIADLEDEISLPTTRSNLNESMNSHEKTMKTFIQRLMRTKYKDFDFASHLIDDYDIIIKPDVNNSLNLDNKEIILNRELSPEDAVFTIIKLFREKNVIDQSGKFTESHNFRNITEGLKFFENKYFDEECADIQLESLFESMRDKLSSDDIKKLGAFMNHAQDADEVVTYMKGLLSEDLNNKVHITYRKSGYGGFTKDGENIDIQNYASKFDEVIGNISGIYVAILLSSTISRSNYDKIIFSNNLDQVKKAATDWLYNSSLSKDKYLEIHRYAMILDLSKNIEIAHGDTWANTEKISKGWDKFSLNEDFDLDEFKDNLEREKDYYGKKAQGLKMLAFPLKRKIEKICNDFWAYEYATAVDDLNDEISLAYEVEGDWKHDHLRFQNAVLNMLYEEGYEDVNHYEDVIDDDGSDTYRAIHTFEIDASKQNQLSESLNEPFLHTTAPGEIDMAIEYFLEECKYSGYKAEITEVAEEDGYFMISGYIDEDVRSETSPSEILDILLDQLDIFDISVDVNTDWQINRLYKRMLFDLTTKYHLENVNESLKEDWSWPPEENGYVNDAHERIAFILDELAKIGFKHDEKYPIRDGLFGRKHIQIINPDLITSEETFEEDVKPLVDVLNNIGEIFGDTARMTYNIGANDNLQVTAGIDVGVK